MEDKKRILLSHGGGGEEMQFLIRDLFLKNFPGSSFDEMEDAALLEVSSKLAFTTDSFTVSPIFFGGGDIGKLSICGTVNDLAVMGAKPLYLSCSFIIEEGFLLEDLETIVHSIAAEAKNVGISIVTGDTKVVPRASMDRIFINTSGIGQVIRDGISSRHIKEGDVILISGSIGDHGAHIMAQREGIGIAVDLKSDCASLWPLVERLIDGGIRIKAMRDPTRGGLAAVLNEWAGQSDIGIEIEESRVPVKSEVQGICELLGLESYHLASEGRFVLAVAEDDADKALEIMRKHPLGKGAEIIGHALSDHQGKVILKSDYGTKKIMETPSGELLPRIC
jgi:hydrogenase expression/formation protein HypE